MLPEDVFYSGRDLPRSLYRWNQERLKRLLKRKAEYLATAYVFREMLCLYALPPSERSDEWTFNLNRGHLTLGLEPRDGSPNSLGGASSQTIDLSPEAE